MAYKNNGDMELYKLKDIILNPSNILDIGANKGQFYNWAKSEWPKSNVYMIEANEVHDEVLKNLVGDGDDYLIAALGDEDREVTFYTRKDKPWTEGASYYKEINYNNEPHLTMKITMRLKRLDDIFDNDTTFELIKLDTQGSELDIIKGGKELCKRANVILLEAAKVPSNEDAPLIDDIMDFMDDFGFEYKFSVGEHYDKNNVNCQSDLVFINKNIK